MPEHALHVLRSDVGVQSSSGVMHYISMVVQQARTAAETPERIEIRTGRGIQNNNNKNGGDAEGRERAEEQTGESTWGHLNGRFTWAAVLKLLERVFCSANLHGGGVRHYVALVCSTGVTEGSCD